MEISSCFHVPASQELFNHLDQKQLLARRQNNDANITDLLVEQTWEDKDGIDEDVSSLGLFVGHNTHIQKIELNGPGLIRPYERDWEPAEFSRQRWRLFAEGMKKNRSIKEIVFVDFREHVWDVVRMLSPFFKCNQALKKVYFLDSHGLHQNGGGLQCLLSSILSRSCPLNEIIFGYDDMSDDMVRAMASSLIRNAPTTPRKITLSPFNQQIGSNGVECLAGVLESSECIVEELILGGRNFGDNMARRFGKALKKNNILRVLDCSGYVELNMISDSGWNSFESVLFDKTSINATYLSNHTLISLGEFSANSNPLPVDLRRHLEWNRNENKRLVARTKVLAHHLMVDSNTNPLKELGPSLLLHAIELVDNVIAENGGEEGLGVGRNVRCTFLFSLLKCNHMMIQGRR